MYFVNSKLQYINHYCSSSEVARAFYQYLTNRKSCRVPDAISVDDDNDFAVWDPPGSLWIGDTQEDIELIAGFTISVFKQHMLSFMEWVKLAKERDWFGVKYYKIHGGNLSCLCIATNEFHELKKILEGEQVIARAHQALESMRKSLHGPGFLGTEIGAKKVLY